MNNFIKIHQSNVQKVIFHRVASIFNKYIRQIELLATVVKAFKEIRWRRHKRKSSGQKWREMRIEGEEERRREVRRETHAARQNGR